jgi:hypothetical protein
VWFDFSPGKKTKENFGCMREKTSYQTPNWHVWVIKRSVNMYSKSMASLRERTYEPRLGIAPDWIGSAAKYVFVHTCAIALFFILLWKSEKSSLHPHNRQNDKTRSGLFPKQNWKDCFWKIFSIHHLSVVGCYTCYRQ